MNTRANMVQRDLVAACAIVLAVAAFLFTWKPALPPGSAPARLTPPKIAYSPDFPPTGDDDSSDISLRSIRDPALIALSSATMLPQDKRGMTDTITPPLDTGSRLLHFTDAVSTARNDRLPLLTPPRPMSPLSPQRIALPPIPARNALEAQRLSSAPSTYRMVLTGDLQGRTVKLAPLSDLSQPSGPWSLSVFLRYDDTGRVQHALLESATLDTSLRNEVVRRLYRCRITPSGTAGEGRLTLYGNGRP